MRINARKSKKEMIQTRTTSQGIKKYRGYIGIGAKRYNTSWTSDIEQARKDLAILLEKREIIRKERREKIEKVRTSLNLDANSYKTSFNGNGIQTRVDYKGDIFYRVNTSVNNERKITEWNISLEETEKQLEEIKAQKVYDNDRQKEAIKQLELEKKALSEQQKEPINILSVNETGKIKGIEERIDKSGNTKYRVHTYINGIMTNGNWRNSLDEAIKDLEKVSAYRVQYPHKNQHTKNDKDIRMSEFLNIYFEYIKTRYKPNSQRNIRSVLTKLYRGRMDLPISEISKVDVMVHLRAMSKRRTAHRNITVLKMLKEYAEAFEYPYTINTARLFEEVRNYSVSDEGVKFISREEVAAIFKYIDDTIKKHERMKKSKNGFREKKINEMQAFKLAIKIALYGGLRRSEVLGLRYKDIQLDKKIINVISVMNLDGTYKIGTKNGKTRLVPMAKQVYEELLRFLEGKTYQPNDYLFAGYDYHFIQSRMFALNQKIKFQDTYGFHTFRHTFASLFFKLKGTAPEALVDLQNILGHSSINMTMHYVHIYKTYSGNLLDGLSYGEAERVEAERLAEEKEKLISVTVALRMLSDQIRVVAPYNKEMIEKYEGIGGKWDAESRTWIFDLSAEQQIKELLKEKFGYQAEVSLDEQMKEVRNQLATLISLSKLNGNTQRIS